MTIASRCPLCRRFRRIVCTSLISDSTTTMLPAAKPRTMANTAEHGYDVIEQNSSLVLFDLCKTISIWFDSRTCFYSSIDEDSIALI